MFFAVMSNLPQIAVGICWTWVFFWLGRRFERWRSSHHFHRAANKEK